MPLPKPNDGESQDDFVSRCMSELDEEFPDEKQRMEVCENQWRTKGQRTYERRSEHLEVRVVDSEDGPRIQGYAAVFNKLSQVLGFGFRERVRPGAFAKALKDGSDIVALMNHNADRILGRTSVGTLELREDDFGLAYDILPPDTQDGRDAVTSIKRGDYRGSSFSFQPVQEEWSKNEKMPVRDLLEVRTFDVGPVVFPAYLDTVVQARSMEEAITLARAYEPSAAHSEAQTPEPGPAHSEPVKVRPISVLAKEWRLAVEAGKYPVRPKEESKNE